MRFFKVIFRKFEWEQKFAWVVVIQSIIASMLAGFFLYHIYRNWDDTRSHRSAGLYQWKQLPSGIWYSDYVGVGKTTEDSHNLIYGMETSPTDMPRMQSMNSIELVMYVDYPIYMDGMEMGIMARGSTLWFGYESVEDFLPGMPNDKWEITTTDTRRGPEGYVRLKLELTRISAEN